MTIIGMMSKEQILALFRHILGWLGTYLFTKGVFTEEQLSHWPEIVGAVMAISSYVWSFFDKKAVKAKIVSLQSALIQAKSVNK